LKPDTNTKTESETKFEERPKAMSAEWTEYIRLFEPHDTTFTSR
jgi:hypothetical protein